MCNRVSAPSTRQLQKIFPQLEVQKKFEEIHHSNGYDHQYLPILTNLQPNLVQPARWGYLPEDARSENDLAKYDTLNARSETLFTTQLYGEAARQRRCVIFVNGFFEFKHHKGIRYPHYICKEDGHLFTFGGVWSDWKGTLTCSIITTPANPLLADIHNQKLRMPYILPQTDWAQWLDMELPQSSVEQLMQPYPAEDLIAWQVGGLLTAKGADANVPEVKAPVGPKYSAAPFPEPMPKQAEAKKKKPQSKNSNPDQLDLF